MKIIKKDVVNHIGEVENINAIKLSHFPSLRVLEFILFKKLKSKNPIVVNDVMDLKISSIIPYVDKVVTENQQAEFFKQAKSLIPEINALVVLTLTDIKKKVEQKNQNQLINELRMHTLNLRSAILTIDDKHYPKGLGFENFPRGCCGNASEILARYLTTKGYQVEYVGGSRDGGTHGWLECEGIIVDITADQFPGVDDFVVKLKNNKKYLGYKEISRYICGDKPIGGNSVREKVEVFYNELSDNYLQKVKTRL